jgi:hypothetical protein
MPTLPAEVMTDVTGEDYTRILYPSVDLAKYTMLFILINPAR